MTKNSKNSTTTNNVAQQDQAALAMAAGAADFSDFAAIDAQAVEAIESQSADLEIEVKEEVVAPAEQVAPTVAAPAPQVAPTLTASISLEDDAPVGIPQQLKVLNQAVTTTTIDGTTIYLVGNELISIKPKVLISHDSNASYEGRLMAAKGGRWLAQSGYVALGTNTSEAAVPALTPAQKRAGVKVVIPHLLQALRDGGEVMIMLPYGFENLETNLKNEALKELVEYFHQGKVLFATHVAPEGRYSNQYSLERFVLMMQLFEMKSVFITECKAVVSAVTKTASQSGTWKLCEMAASYSIPTWISPIKEGATPEAHTKMMEYLGVQQMPTCDEDGVVFTSFGQQMECLIR